MDRMDLTLKLYDKSDCFLQIRLALINAFFPLYKRENMIEYDRNCNISDVVSRKTDKCLRN